MAQSKSIRILEVLQVSPPQLVTVSAVQVLEPLTFFELLWLRTPPVQALLFYEFPYATAYFLQSIIPRLTLFLSRTLEHFLPPGNLTWPHDSLTPSWIPGDSFVSLTLAESGADFNHLSGTTLCEAPKTHSLLPDLAMCNEQVAVFARQLTVFPNSGFSIGMTVHPALMDGKSLTSFFISWASSCSKLLQKSSPKLPAELVPICDRSVIKDPNGIDTIYANEWLNQGGPNNRSLWNKDHKVQAEAVRGTFQLAHPDIEKLKQFVVSKLKKKDHVSTFSLTCAYVWACLVKAEDAKAKRTVLTICVDCRDRLDPPLPPNYFGKCDVGKIAVAETENLIGKDGFVSAMEAIGEALDTLKDGVLSGAESWVSKVKDSELMGNRIIYVAGSPHFELYSVDFGWGRPIKVEIPSIDRIGQAGVFSLSEGKHGQGGVEIGLTLKRHEMEAFSSLFMKGVESV